MNIDEIVDRLGANDWEQVKGVYSEMSGAEINNHLDGMFSSEDNTELASAIFEELN